MHRIIALAWVAAALFTGHWGISIALGPKGDPSAWLIALALAAAAAYSIREAFREWNSRPTAAAKPSTPTRSDEPTSAPGAWSGPRVALETQIDALKAAGLVPGARAHS